MRATHKVKCLGFVCSPSFFSHRRVSPFSHGVIFTYARLSLALISLHRRKMSAHALLKMTRDLFRVMSLAPRRKCPQNVVQMREAGLLIGCGKKWEILRHFQEAGTKVGPDQLGSPVRVGSTRIDSDQLGSNKKIKIKQNWTRINSEQSKKLN